MHGCSPVGTGRCGAYCTYLGDALVNVWISDLPAADGGLDTSRPESRAAMLFIAAILSILLRISGCKKEKKGSKLVWLHRASQLRGERECSEDQTRDVQMAHVNSFSTTTGVVRSPCHLLKNDLTWCEDRLGSSASRKAASRSKMKR